MNENLKSALEKKQLSVYGLAKHLGIPVQNAQYIVKSKNLSADLILLQKIADYCEEPIEDLFG